MKETSFLPGGHITLPGPVLARTVLELIQNGWIRVHHGPAQLFKLSAQAAAMAVTSGNELWLEIDVDRAGGCRSEAEYSARVVSTANEDPELASSVMSLAMATMRQSMVLAAPRVGLRRQGDPSAHLEP